MQARETQRKILQIIAGFQEHSPNQFVSDDQIAEKLNLNIEDVRMYLDLLEEENTVKLAKTFGAIVLFLHHEGK